MNKEIRGVYPAFTTSHSKQEDTCVGFNLDWGVSIMVIVRFLTMNLFLVLKKLLILSANILLNKILSNKSSHILYSYIKIALKNIHFHLKRKCPWHSFSAD